MEVWNFFCREKWHQVCLKYKEAYRQGALLYEWLNSLRCLWRKMLIMIMIIFPKALKRFWVEVCRLVMGDTSASGGRFVVSPVNTQLHCAVQHCPIPHKSSALDLFLGRACTARAGVTGQTWASSPSWLSSSIIRLRLSVPVSSPSLLEWRRPEPIGSVCFRTCQVKLGSMNIQTLMRVAFLNKWPNGNNDPMWVREEISHGWM